MLKHGKNECIKHLLLNTFIYAGFQKMIFIDPTNNVYWCVKTFQNMLLFIRKC